MAEKFAATYDPVVSSWINWKYERDDLPGLSLVTVDETGEVKYDVGTTLYADDICETYVFTDAADLQVKFDASSERLNAEIQPLGLQQNQAKAENLIWISGRGTVAE